MDAYVAVTSRRVVRGFTDEPVVEGGAGARLVRRGLGAVRIELQPWHVYVLTGEPLE